MAKVNKGDTIRFDLDMNEGTMKVAVNDADQGVCFTGMQVRMLWAWTMKVAVDVHTNLLWYATGQGYEVWPAIQFYSSNRTVRVLKLEGPITSEVSRRAG